jgi:hypothetical protein
MLMFAVALQAFLNHSAQFFPEFWSKLYPQILLVPNAKETQSRVSFRSTLRFLNEQIVDFVAQTGKPVEV